MTCYIDTICSLWVQGRTLKQMKEFSSYEAILLTKNHDKTIIFKTSQLTF